MKNIYTAGVFVFVLINSFAQSCPGLGSINYQRWNNITGSAVTNLTSNPNYPNSPSTSGTYTIFEIPENSGNNFGMKVYGYICPPTTGNYIFWIASDESAELWLSTTISPANKVRIAYNTSATKSRQWTKSATQKSVAISLLAGQKYYIEVLMKEGTGSDNLSVAWTKPGQNISAPGEVIPGTYLSVNNSMDSQPPTAPSNLAAANIVTTSFTFSWSPSTDNVGVIGYDVYKNGLKMNAATLIGTSYSVTGVLPNTTYSMTVVAKDAVGNQSTSIAMSVSTIPTILANESFSVRTVIGNQRMPHDLVYGPDNNIWYTERFAGRVNYIDPLTNIKTVVLTLGSKMVLVGGQDGLMGLALHPQFLTGKPFVYISYTYQSLSSTVRKTRIERYTYNFSTRVLESPVTILENIPGSNDHNSARIAIGPDLKLYYSVGDMGAGQFDNISRTNNAQNINIYEGKILRLNTEPDGVGSWIPSDNPFTNGGQKTAVYTLGHRNPQGLVWGNVNGADILYSSEHGPFSDDEINVIQVGRNYGWPQVAGYCDGNYNGMTIGGFAVVNEQNNCATLNAKEPLRSIFPSSNPPTGGDNMTWPSMAPSGTDFYGSVAIPGWQNSLLIATLKAGVIARYKLSNDGQSIISDTINYFRGMGRYRDIVVSPDGLKLYVACDSSGSTSGPTGNVTTTPANPGSILEFTYQPAAPARAMSQLLTESKVSDDLKDKSIDIYPNPAHTYFIIYNYAVENRLVQLFDINGKLVKNIQTKELSTKVNINDLSNGLYVLRIKEANGKNIRTEKIIIAR
ncbi:MAG: T9SS type A sorting domain-containing protein [Bacteroidetes bacterium]|nr:MAG: T9SS type A sorting domain-containing protein [Bacteroidota bacterium]